MSVIKTSCAGCKRRLYENNSIPVNYWKDCYVYYCSIGCIFKHVLNKLIGK
jgi:hypothetical protein